MQAKRPSHRCRNPRAPSKREHKDQTEASKENTEPPLHRVKQLNAPPVPLPPSRSSLGRSRSGCQCPSCTSLGIEGVPECQSASRRGQRIAGMIEAFRSAHLHSSRLKLCSLSLVASLGSLLCLVLWMISVATSRTNNCLGLGFRQDFDLVLVYISGARDRDMVHIGSLRQREDALTGQAGQRSSNQGSALSLRPHGDANSHSQLRMSQEGLIKKTCFVGPNLPRTDERSLSVSSADHQGPHALPHS